MVVLVDTDLDEVYICNDKLHVWNVVNGILHDEGEDELDLNCNCYESVGFHLYENVIDRRTE